MLEKINNQKGILNLIIFSCIVLFFNLNQVMDYVLVVLLVYTLFKADIIEILYSFLFFSFFDDALQFSLFGGSISRVIMIIMFLRGAIYVIRYRIKPSKKEIIIASFLMASLAIGIITNNFSFGDIIICVNIALLVVYSLIGRYEIKDINKALKDICTYVFVAVIIAIIYGTIRGNFLFEETGSLQVYRFSGTYEPNFMGMYINIAIVIVLFTPGIKKAIRYIILAFLIGSLGMTLSMSGIAICGIALIIYIFCQKKEILRRFFEVSIAGILALVIFIVGQYSFTMVNHISLSTQDAEEVTEQQETTETVEDYQENVETTEPLPEETDVDGNDDVEAPVTPPDENVEDSSDSSITVDEVVEKNFLVQRLETLWTELKEGDFDTLTSGRLPIIRSFLTASFDRSAIEILFGNGLQDEQIYCEFFGRDKEAHNSYINCLYNFGIVGFVLIMIGLVKILKNPKIFGYDLKTSTYGKTFMVMQWMLLLYALVLSLYTKRMFLAFFIL